MRQLLTLAFIIVSLAAAAAKNTDNEPNGERVVLRSAREIRQITVNGNAVVELRHHPRYSGYIVYYTADNSAPRIEACSDGSHLTITADSTANAITSRVVILCHAPFTSITNNDAVVLCRYMRTTSLDITNNGDGAVYMSRLTADTLSVTNNSSRTVSIRRAKVDDALITNNLSGDIRIGGTSTKALLTINGTGSVTASDFIVKSMTASLNGEGSASCSVKDLLTVNQLGSGTISSHHYPRQIDANVDADKVFQLIEKQNP